MSPLLFRGKKEAPPLPPLLFLSDIDYRVRCLYVLQVRIFFLSLAASKFMCLSFCTLQSSYLWRIDIIMFPLSSLTPSNVLEIYKISSHSIQLLTVQYQVLQFDKKTVLVQDLYNTFYGFR